MTYSAGDQVEFRRSSRWEGGVVFTTAGDGFIYVRTRCGGVWKHPNNIRPLCKLIVIGNELHLGENDD